MSTEKRRGPKRQMVSKYTGEPYDAPGYVEVRCCGEWLECAYFTNTCPTCESDYNMSGSLLAPRSQWGEETGEHWTDIIHCDR